MQGDRVVPLHRRLVAGKPRLRDSESESEMFLFDPYQKYIQSNNETILDQGTPINSHPAESDRS